MLACLWKNVASSSKAAMAVLHSALDSGYRRLDRESAGANIRDRELTRRPARSSHSHTTDRPEAAAIRRLAMLLATCTPGDGCFELAAPGVYAIRRSKVTNERMRAT